MFNGDLAGERDLEAGLLAHERRSGVARRRDPKGEDAARVGCDRRDR